VSGLIHVFALRSMMTIIRIGHVVRRRRRKGAAPGRRRDKRAGGVNDPVVFVDRPDSLTGGLLGEVAPLSLASPASRGGDVCITVRSISRSFKSPATRAISGLAATREVWHTRG
jgi:hypothetical protein